MSVFSAKKSSVSGNDTALRTDPVTVSYPAAEPETSTVTETETSTVTETETVFEEPEPPAPEPEEPKEWAPFYRDYLLDFLNVNVQNQTHNFHLFRFGLIYIDDDNIPELWYISGTYAHGPGFELVTYRNGEAVMFAEGVTDLYYHEKSGIFAFRGFSGKIDYVNYFKMTEYGFENLDSFHTDKYGDTVYYVNDIQVSEDEYNERYDSYVLNYGERIILNTNDGFPFTEENILQCCS